MMSSAGDEEEEDECFHDSFDRLISSSNTSCSSSALPSDEEEDRFLSHSGSPNYACPNALSIPCFPVGASDNYDVWISEPSSVDERRLSLLRRIGLNRDPSILRHRPSLSAAEGSSPGDAKDFFGESEWSDHLRSGIDKGEHCLTPESNNSRSSNKISRVPGVVRSKSECNRHSSHYRSSSSSPVIHRSTDKATIGSIHPWSSEADAASVVDPVAVNTSQIHSLSVSDVYQMKTGIGSPLADSVSQKTPTGCNFGNVEEALRSTLVEDAFETPVCIIKDLDNGKAFVVNEVSEDGTWNKLKELGTGRQLTMEEFEICVGTSPIVQELMRRQNVEDGGKDGLNSNSNGGSGSGFKLKRTGNWLKNIKNVANSVAGYKDWLGSDEKDASSHSSEKGGRRSSSATDDSQDVSFHGLERVKVRQYGKSCKDITALYKIQEIQAHSGSIWSMKFSLDGKYLASAGEDCVIHVWQVTESERKNDLLDKPEDPNTNLLLLMNGSPELASISPNFDGHMERKRRGRPSISRKSASFDHVVMPETVFALSEKPTCSFQGHLNDVLDLSWSKSQHLLSSSMDKTVRLWHLSSNSCLKIFSHSDYVTCIQFNPVDDRYFISGSLDAKVRIWSIPDRQVVDWNDLHEMITAASYTPDGQRALVGSYKGSCHLYNTSENKLQQKDHINLQNKKKKSHQKKITGFQFVPGSTTEVLVTSSDSRIRVIDGVDLVHKFKGFRNTNSQISASLTADGKYVVCASEDSCVYVWKHEGPSRPGRNRGVTVTQAYENFYCQDVSVAIPWPGMSGTSRFPINSSTGQNGRSINSHDEVLATNHPTTPAEDTNGTISSAMSSYFFDKMSATWPEEKLISATKTSRRAKVDASIDITGGLNQIKPAWGLVILTASVHGEIKTFQNFGLPFRI
ncbi:unnamed protein product [Cuscuta epithymum]|uniref:WD repeat-containing protein 44 n=1 Tax=Cuscuta epithymum TaxID=186058 RepID=A0AAV0DTJ1_9ASTE|nr:unnamed protein product [Cuscuta epithymum]